MPIVHIDLRPPHERRGASILVCETTIKGAKQPDCKFACARPRRNAAAVPQEQSGQCFAYSPKLPT